MFDFPRFYRQEGHRRIALWSYRSEQRRDSSRRVPVVAKGPLSSGSGARRLSAGSQKQKGKHAKRIGLLAIAVAFLATACASQSQFLAEKQPIAVQTALRRGQFDLNCQTTTAEVLSADYIQRPVAGNNPESLAPRYTIGVMDATSGQLRRDLRGRTDTCFAAQPQGSSGASRVREAVSAATALRIGWTHLVRSQIGYDGAAPS